MSADRYAVRFVPRENGVHLIHLRLNGNHIPGSPFRLFVGKQDADASLVRAYGDGLSHGMTGRLLNFLHVLDVLLTYYLRRRRSTAAPILRSLCHDVCGCVGMCECVGMSVMMYVSTIKRKPPIAMT